MFVDAIISTLVFYETLVYTNVLYLLKDLKISIPVFIVCIEGREKKLMWFKFHRRPL